MSDRLIALETRVARLEAALRIQRETKREERARPVSEKPSTPPSAGTLTESVRQMIEEAGR